jgi:hypothetical protein
MLRTWGTERVSLPTGTKEGTYTILCRPGLASFIPAQSPPTASASNEPRPTCAPATTANTKVLRGEFAAFLTPTATALAYRAAEVKDGEHWLAMRGKT